MTFEIKPSGLPALVRQLADGAMDEGVVGSLRMRGRSLGVSGRAAEIAFATTWARTEQGTLRRSPTLFYVGEDMMDLGLAAAEHLPRFSLAPEDLPARSGFAYLAKPIPLVDGDGDPMPVRAISWATVAGFDDSAMLGQVVGADGAAGVGERVVIFYYADTDGVWSGENAGSRSSFTAPLFPFEFDVSEFGYDYTAHARDVGSAADVKLSIKALKSVWLLAQQERITDVTTVKAGKPPAPRGGRTPKRPEVHVITLRRRSDTPAGGEAEREWRHRWIVRGHWRMQPWGPKRSRVRPVWIEPHIKGPEGAPMLGGDKVYHLKH